uniref:Uncharacterized protein n=1 Tax=Rhodosorus marinus TaxID=101924 RepID=A0A6T6MSE0_9RHOD|mmetsp:Transcript_2516/g.3694  ORF Transcript_2516/g.3694 Transcript_2516/m.3694 type:complete len:170 (+) Transcript_2516:319-828(+)
MGLRGTVVVWLALVVCGVLGSSSEVYDSRCDYVVTDKQLCAEYPFLGGQVSCDCPDDNALNDWFCCVNEPLVFQNGSFPTNMTLTENIDCWCESDFTAGGWTCFVTLYGVAIICGLLNLGYLIYKTWSNRRKAKRAEEEVLTLSLFESKLESSNPDGSTVDQLNSTTAD